MTNHTQDRFSDNRFQHTPWHVTARYDVAAKGTIGQLETQLAELVGDDNGHKICRDVFADLYWPGLKRVEITGEEGPAQRAADAILDTLAEQQDWQDLKTRCALDGWAAVAAWPTVEKALSQAMLRVIENQNNEEGDVGDDVEESMVQDEAGLSGALANADDDAQSVQMIRGLLGGKEDALMDDSLVELIPQIIERPAIRKMLARMGQLSQSFDMEASKARVRGAQQPIGVSLGSSVRALLPSELCRIGMGGSIEDETMSRIVRGQAYQYDQVHIDRAKGGAFSVLIDRSGSMSALWQSAVSFAGAALLSAHRQGRSVRLFAFNRSVTEVPVDMSTTQSIVNTVVGLFNLSVDGGTCILESMKTTADGGDALILTDGCDEGASLKTKDQYKQAGYAGIYVVDLMGCDDAGKPMYAKERAALIDASDSWVSTSSVDSQNVALTVGQAAVGV